MGGFSLIIIMNCLYSHNSNNRPSSHVQVMLVQLRNSTLYSCSIYTLWASCHIKSAVCRTTSLKTDRITQSIIILELEANFQNQKSLMLPPSNQALQITNQHSPKNVSPSWSFVAPSISIQSPNHQIYDSFQFKDHVTHQKTKLRNLHSSSQSPPKSKHKSKKFIWTGQMYEHEKEEKIKYLQSLMAYIEQVKNIRDNRNNALVTHCKIKKLIRDGQISPDQDDINARRSMESSHSDLTSINLRSSLDEKIARQKKITDQMKKKIYQINLQEFRKYYRKEQAFNPKNQNLMNLPNDFCRVAPFKQVRRKENKKESGKKSKKYNELKEKIRQDYDHKFETETSSFSELLRMRFVHETHFNWQKCII